MEVRLHDAAQGLVRGSKRPQRHAKKRDMSGGSFGLAQARRSEVMRPPGGWQADLTHPYESTVCPQERHPEVVATREVTDPAYWFQQD
jgi:hypothetical protein